MATVGYARVSSTGQSLDVQLEKLKAAGCEEIFAEKRSGTTTDGREALAEALRYVRKGDILLCTRLDRLARSVADLSAIVNDLAKRGIGFKALDQDGIDTTTSNGRLMLNMLASFAEFETDLRRERQREGIDKAKAAGVYKGRPATIKAEEIKALKAEGLGASAIAKRLGIGRASVYRVLDAADAVAA
jgi:DNA invertase Pin-like site-specific DNA recombinase